MINWIFLIEKNYRRDWRIYNYATYVEQREIN